MLKYSIKFVTIAFLLAITLNPANAILFNGSALETNQLSIDYPMIIHCSPNESSIEHNIVIVIDASSSTMGIDSGSGISFNGLIVANAIKIIRNGRYDSGIGIVSFGGNILKTEILPMSNEANKAVLEDFIKRIYPKDIKSPTNLGSGLLSAQDLLNSVNGTREIIVISDGMLSTDGFDELKKNVTELKNRDIKTHFIQTLMSYTLIKEPNKLYNELANVYGGQAIVLNPDERVSLIEEIPSADTYNKKPCSTSVDVINTISVFTIDGNSIDGAEISLDDIPIGKTNETGMISFNVTISGLHNISATKPGYEKAMKMIYVLAAPMVTQNPTVTPNQTLSQESLNVSNQSKEMSSEKKEIPGFKGVFAFLVLFAVIMFQRLSDV